MVARAVHDGEEIPYVVKPAGYGKLTYGTITELLRKMMPRTRRFVEADIAASLPEPDDYWHNRRYFYVICNNGYEERICQNFIDAFYQRIMMDSFGAIEKYKNGLDVSEGMMYSNLNGWREKGMNGLQVQYVRCEDELEILCGHRLPEYDALTLLWKYPFSNIEEEDEILHVIFQGA